MYIYIYIPTYIHTTGLRVPGLGFRVKGRE